MPSAHNKFISNQEAIPVVDSDIFCGYADRRFALGAFGPEDVLSYKPNSLFQAYLQLRANVYVDQTRMLDGYVKRNDGTEIDINDERSGHFIVFENRHLGRVAVVGCGRMIEKNDNNPLPIEEFFPEAFSEPAPVGSLEISRFIVRHDEPNHARDIKRNLMTAGLSNSISNNRGPIFAVVEEGFERDMRLMRLPISRIAEPKQVEEYNDVNLGIELNIERTRHLLGEKAVKRLSLAYGSFGYWGEVSFEK